MTTNVEAPVASTSKKFDSLPSLLKSIKVTSSENISIPDDIDDPNSTSFSQLLSLTTQSLDDLRTQPAALTTASSSLETQLSNLCSRHVSSFVRVHSASSALPSSLDKLDIQLDKLIDHDLQLLSEAAQKFPGNVERSLAARNKARNLLDQYETSLKDLLDIPRLLITCAKANHPIEALQLGIHMAKIARADIESGQKSVTIKALREECWTHLMRLREDLLRGLGARGVRLPAARRYVSLLQRLHDIDRAFYGDQINNTSRLAISQSAICLSFLRSRWILVEDLGAHDSDEQIANNLSSQISSWRDLVGDTCNIAMALFGDKELQNGTGESNDETNDDEISPLSLISSFGYRSISKLEQLVSRILPSIDGKQGSLQDAFEMLASLHLQLSYSAASLSRQGLDFSDVSGARKAFEDQSLELWSSGIKGVIEAFENSLGTSATLSVSDMIGSDDIRDVLRNVNLETIRNSEDWSLQVSFFPPLATLANGILDIHDAFISFAPISIGKDALKAFDFAMTDLLAHMLESFRKADSDQTATSSSVRIYPLVEGIQSDKESKSKRRLHEATITIAARFLATLSESLLSFLRNSTSSLFEREFSLTPSLDSTLRSISEWTNEVEQKWKLAEESRVTEVKKAEDDRLAAEEAEKKRLEAEQKRLRQEEEDRIRLAEEVRLREEEERKKREEEEERLRKEEEEKKKKRLEEERLRQEEEIKRLEKERLRKEKEEKRLADEKEKKRIEDEKKKAAEEEEARKLAEKERQKREEEERQKEEERKRLEEEERKKRLVEEEEKKKRLVEEEEKKKRLIEEEEKKRQAEEDEKKRLADEEQKRIAEEESKRHQEEEDQKKKAEEAKKQEEEEAKIEEPQAATLEKQNDASHDTIESKQSEVNEGKTSNAVSEDEDENKEKNATDTAVKDKKKKKKKKKKGNKTPDLVQAETVQSISEGVSETEQPVEKASGTPQEASSVNAATTTADEATEESAKVQEHKPSEEAVSKVDRASKEDTNTQGKEVAETEMKAEETPKQPVKTNNKLAEKLRKRQEERERAAAAAAAASKEA